MVGYFDARQDAEASVPAQAGLSRSAAVVASTITAVFGPDAAATLSPANQPLATVPPRTAMYAVIGGLRCSLYADPKVVNVRTPGSNAVGHLRAHALHGEAIVPNPRGNPFYAGVRYADAMMLGSTPELADAEVFADEAAGRAPRRGLVMSATERKAIESRAVRVTTKHLEALGYRVDDVGAYESFDLDVRRGEERLFVEVKGTTTSGDAVVLTKNEVELHRTHYPNNALAVVRRIELDRSAAAPVARGGELILIQPWLIEDEGLTALSYQYVTGVNRSQT